MRSSTPRRFAKVVATVALSVTVFAVGCAARQAGYVQMRKPTVCQAGTQPAIVGFQQDGRVLTPTWQCLAACPAGQEYVAVVVSGEPGYDELRDTYIADRDHETVVSPTCRKQCDTDWERRTFVERHTMGCKIDLAGQCVVKDYNRHDRHANGC